MHCKQEAGKVLLKDTLLFVVIVQGAHLEPPCPLNEMLHQCVIWKSLLAFSSLLHLGI